MPFEAAICPRCGGNLNLDDSLETGYCQYCGSKIIVRDAIQKYKVEISGRVSMSGISSVENDIERGRQCLSAKDWENAFKVFSNAVEKQADCFDAWMGCLTAMTQDYTRTEYKQTDFEGVKGLDSIIRNCLKYAGPEQKDDVRGSIERTLGVMQNAIDKYKKEVKRTAPFAATFIALGFAVVCTGCGMFLVNVWLAFGLLFGGFIIMLIGGFAAPQKNANIPNEADIRHIRAVLEEVG